MKTYTWQQQRKEIINSVIDFFGERIDVTPRAMGCLQAPCNNVLDWVGREEPNVLEVNIFEALIKTSPACATTLLKAGVALEKLEFPSTQNIPAPLNIEALDWIFAGIDSKYCVPTVDKIIETKTLTEIDIFVASIEASIQGSEPNATGSTILDAAGIKRPPFIRGNSNYIWKECNKYLKSIISRIRQVPIVDSSHSYFQFILYVDDTNKVRIRPFGATDITNSGLISPLKDGQTFIFRGGIVQPIETVSRELNEDSLTEFEDLLETEKVSENDFQRFFEQHPQFLLGLDFSKAHPQPILYQDDGSKLIPDFFLEKLSNGWDSILDLKRPYDDMISRRRNRVYFKQHIHNAISQLRFYREWFDSPTNRKLFEETYGVKTFRPKMIIVIGRDHHFYSDVERIRLLESLPSQLEFWTFDDLLNRARKYLNLFSR